MGLVTLGGRPIANGLYNAGSALYGVSDPSLAVGGYFVDAWTANHPFIDISKQMSTWYISGGDTMDDLISGGYVDADSSWITGTTLPGTVLKNCVTSDDDEFFNGKQYRMQWTGAGTMVAPVGSTVNSTSSNEIVFTLGSVDGGGFAVGCSAGPISSLTIVDTNNTTRFDAGERIDPDYAALVANFRQFRFMDWNLTNDAYQTTWASRPVPAQNSYSDSGWGHTEATTKPGVPLEIAVMLCNKCKMDMWWNFGHAVDDNHITQAATYIRDNLHADLKCTFEYGNETWNDGFSEQRTFLAALGNTLWPSAGENDVDMAISAFGYRTYEMANLIDAVFSGQLSRRVITQGIGGSYTRIAAQTDAPVWADHHDDGDSTSDAYVAPYTVMQEMSGTGYYGTGLLTTDRRAEIVADYATSPATSDVTIDGYLRATGATGLDVWSIDALTDAWDTLNDMAIARSLKLSMYEGGPHMLYSDEDAAYPAILHWLQSSYGADFFDDLFDAWQLNSEAEAPFMQFQDVGWHDTGTWTVWQHMDDTPAGYHAQLLVRNASDGNWWSDTTDHRHEAI